MSVTSEGRLPLRAVFLVGGSGTRLWPMSRETYPKQFLPLFDGRSPLELTCARVAQVASGPPVAIANETHRFIAAEQLRLSGFPDDGTLLLEPEGRNTAPAIALAALLAVQDGADALLLVLPSDHVVQDVAAFTDAVRTATAQAQAGRMVTFGVVPDYPETGYGYIRIADAELNPGGGVYAVESFVEKPDATRAQAYLNEGHYLWNSGMFLFRASSYLSELERFRPDIVQACRLAMAQLRHDGDFTRLDEAAFRACPAQSVDYALMESTDRAACVPLQAGWSDIGSWDAMRRLGRPDAAGNVLDGDVLAIDSRNVYARADSRLVALLGVNDLVVVETPDAILVADAGHAQNVRDVVAALKAQQRNEAVSPRRVVRPWGHYDCIDDGERFQVKRITVKPGGQLSLQLHHHRAEHWVVVRGTARVSRGDETFLLSENQSTYIPLGVRHRLENPGSIPLELVEVQSGAYLGEDDIVRFDDRYGR